MPEQQINRAILNDDLRWTPMNSETVRESIVSPITIEDINEATNRFRSFLETDGYTATYLGEAIGSMADRPTLFDILEKKSYWDDIQVGDLIKLKSMSTFSYIKQFARKKGIKGWFNMTVNSISRDKQGKVHAIKIALNGKDINYTLSKSDFKLVYPIRRDIKDYLKMKKEEYV